MANGNATIIVGSARLGSARLGSASCSSLQLVSDFISRTSCRRQGALCLGFGFLRLPKGWWFDIEVLTTTGKSIFSG